MRPPLTVGILAETKNKWERRAPLTPADVRWMINRGISVEVAASDRRIYPTAEYEQAGAKIVEGFQKASFLIGIKEPVVAELKHNCIYMVFSHTVKGQPSNRELLAACIDKNIVLLDYEKIETPDRRRLVAFGRFAGICGCMDSLFYAGQRLEHLGYTNPFTGLKPVIQYDSLISMKKDLDLCRKLISEKGFVKELRPFVIGITGHGNVGRGAKEIIDCLAPVDIHPKDMGTFIEQKRHPTHKIYRIIFDREEKIRSKKGKGFYFEDYLEHPEKFESRLDEYLPWLNILLHCSYWEARYPRLVTRKMMQQAYRTGTRLALIGDLSCDIQGAIEFTDRVTTPDNPVYTYEPVTKSYRTGIKGEGIVMLSRDNLPAELPRESSEDFSAQIRDYVYQIAAHGVYDLIEHAGLPREIRNAVITEGGRLCPHYAYLRHYLVRPEKGLTHE